MTFFARVTRPLSSLDGPVNRVSDLGNRVAPWVWWPTSPPRPDRRYGAGQHAVLVTWSAAGYVVGDVLTRGAPEDERLISLRAERTAAVLAAVATWLVFVGAWDRRAERLRRRPWRRA